MLCQQTTSAIIVDMLAVFKLVTHYVCTATDYNATMIITKDQAVQQLIDVLCLVILNCKCLCALSCYCHVPCT